MPPGNHGSEQGTAVSLHSAVAVSLCLHLQPASQPSSYTPATSSLFVLYALQGVHSKEPPHLPISAGKGFPTSTASNAPLQHCSCSHLQTHTISQPPQSTADTHCSLHSPSDSGYTQEKIYSKLGFLFPCSAQCIKGNIQRILEHMKAVYSILTAKTHTETTPTLHRMPLCKDISHTQQH